MKDDAFIKQLAVFKQRLEERLVEINKKEIFNCGINDQLEWDSKSHDSKLNLFNNYKKRIEPHQLSKIYEIVIAYIESTSGFSELQSLQHGEALAFDSSRITDEKTKTTSTLANYGILFDNFQDEKGDPEFQLVFEPNSNREIMQICEPINNKNGTQGKIREVIRIDQAQPQLMMSQTFRYIFNNPKQINSFHDDILKCNAAARRSDQWYGAVTKPYTKIENIAPKRHLPKYGKVHQLRVYFPAANQILGPDLRAFMSKINSLTQEKSITLGDWICIVYQIIDQIKKIHDIKYSHGNLRTLNILINDKGRVKIGNFSPIAETCSRMWSPEKWLGVWQTFREVKQEHSKSTKSDLEKLSEFDELFVINKPDIPVKSIDVYAGPHLLQQTGNVFKTYQRLFKFHKAQASIAEDTYSTGHILLEILETFKNKEYRKNFSREELIRLNSFSYLLEQLIGNYKPSVEQRLLHAPDALAGHHLLSPILYRMTLDEILIAFNQFLCIHIKELTFSSHLETKRYLTLTDNPSFSVIESPLLTAFDAVDDYLTETICDPNTSECYQDWHILCHVFYKEFAQVKDTESLKLQRKKIFFILSRSINYFKDKDNNYHKLLQNIWRLIHDEIDTSRTIYLSPQDIQLFNMDLEKRLFCYETHLQLVRDAEKCLVKFDENCTEQSLPTHYLPSLSRRLRHYQQSYRNYQICREENYPLQRIKLARANDTIASHKLLFKMMNNISLTKLSLEGQLTTQQLNSLIASVQSSPTIESKAIRESLSHNIYPQNLLCRIHETKSTFDLESTEISIPQLTAVESFGFILQNITKLLQKESQNNLDKNKLRQNAHWANFCYLLNSMLSKEPYDVEKEEKCKEQLIKKLQEGRRRFRSFWPWSVNPYVGALTQLETKLTRNDAKFNEISQQFLISDVHLFKMCDDYFAHKIQNAHKHFSSPKHQDYLFILKFIWANLQITPINRQSILHRLHTSIHEFDGRYQVCLQEIHTAIANDSIILTSPELKAYLDYKVETQRNSFLKPFVDIDRYLERRLTETQADNSIFFNSHDVLCRQHSYLQILLSIQNMHRNGDLFCIFTTPSLLHAEQVRFNRIFGRNDYANRLSALQTAFANQTIINDSHLRFYIDQQVTYYKNVLRKTPLRILDQIEDYLQQMNTPLTLNIIWRNVLSKIHKAENNASVLQELTTIINNAIITSSNKFFYQQLTNLQQAFSLESDIETGLKEYAEQQKLLFWRKDILITQFNNLLNNHNPQGWPDIVKNFHKYEHTYIKCLVLRSKYFSNNINHSDRPNARELLCDPRTGEGILLQIIQQKYPELSLEQKIRQAKALYQSLLTSEARTFTKVIDAKKESKEEIKEKKVEKALPTTIDISDSKLNPISLIDNSFCVAKENLSQTITIECRRLRQQKEGHCCFVRANHKAALDANILTEFNNYYLQLPQSSNYLDYLENAIYRLIKKLNDKNTCIALERCLPYFRQTQLALLKSLSGNLSNQKSDSKSSTETLHTHIKHLQKSCAIPLPFEQIQKIIESYQPQLARLSSVLTKQALIKCFPVKEAKNGVVEKNWVLP